MTTRPLAELRNEWASAQMAAHHALDRWIAERASASLAGRATEQPDDRLLSEMATTHQLAEEAAEAWVAAHMSE